ncbi:MAG: hypothetical protein M1830_007829 [Pleopsidium flavum]|nr:MAG: hypothetical protein M1830_007829 [Pleopsidium flavum]
MSSKEESVSVKAKERSHRLSSAPSISGPGTLSIPDTHDPNSVEKSLRTVDEPAKAPRNVSGPLWWLVVLSILSTTFLFSLDNTIVADVQPSIVRQFDATEELPWLSVAFLLGAASTNLFWGQCYGQFDAKYIYILCIILFEIGSAVCGAAPSMDALIVGRAICGLGGAGMYTGVMTLLTVTTLPHERPIYFGLCGLTWGTGTILGPIIGELVVTSQRGGLEISGKADNALGWRFAFWINLFVGGVCAPVYLLLLPRADPRPTVSFKDRIAQIDLPGTVLMCGIFAAGLMAISFGGSLFPWHSGRIIGLFVTAGILLIIFIIQQSIGSTASQQLFPVQFLKSRIMIMAFLATASAATVIFAPVYFIPLYFQFVRGDIALQAGVRLLPYVAFNVTTAMANGIVMSKKPYYMPWYMASGALSVIGSALLYTVDETTSSAKIYGYSIILGVGGGGFVQLSFTVVQAKVEKRLIPVAIGFCTFAQLAGPAVALSIANAVFLNEATNGIADLAPHLSRATIQTAISGVGSHHQIEGLSPEMQRMILHTIVNAMSKIYFVPLSAGALTLVMSVFMKRERLFVEGSVAV